MTLAASIKVDGIFEQWLKDVIPWMRAQYGLKAFQIQTDNREFASRRCRDLAVAQGSSYILLVGDDIDHRKLLACNWRNGIGDVDQQWSCRVIWEQVKKYSVDIYNRVPLVRTSLAGIRMSPHD